MSHSALVHAWLGEAAETLREVSPRPRREAELLLMACLDVDQLWLITRQNDTIEITPQLNDWLARRAAHEPLEYICGRVSFYSQTFHIEPGALIPRPETELLIDELLARVSRESDATIVEVGVGSGIISIVLAQHLPKAKFIAVDISEDALSVARKNIERFGFEERIELRRSDLLNAVDEGIDILVSNPPYIAHNALLEKNLSYEPQNALFGGEVGDEIIKKLLDAVIERGIGMFACEMGYDQKAKIEAYFEKFLPDTLEFYRDYAGFDRGFIVRMKNA